MRVEKYAGWLISDIGGVVGGSACTIARESGRSASEKSDTMLVEKDPY